MAQLLIGATGFAPAALFASTTTDSVCGGAGTSCSPAALTAPIGQIASTLLTVAGAIAVIIIIVGGITYVTSTGDSGRVKQAKDTILYAIIGLVVTVVAYAIVHFVIGNIK